MRSCIGTVWHQVESHGEGGSRVVRNGRRKNRVLELFLLTGKKRDNV